MNAHFSAACNSVAFTWGTQKVYHAAQFGEQFAHPLGIKPSHPSVRQPFWRQDVGQALGGLAGVAGGGIVGGFAGGALGHVIGSSRDDAARHREYMRQKAINDRLQQNIDRDAPGPEAQLPSFLQEPFEGDETGPEVWTDEDEAMLQHLTNRWAAAQKHATGKWYKGIEPGGELPPGEDEFQDRLRDRRERLTGHRYKY